MLLLAKHSNFLPRIWIFSIILLHTHQCLARRILIFLVMSSLDTLYINVMSPI